VYTGDPNAGFHTKQPGGFCFNVLPYIEQQAVYDMGKGSSDAVRRAQGALREGIPIPTFICPSRRDATSHITDYTAAASGFYSNINWPPFVCKTDYAGNAGDGSDLSNGNPSHCSVGIEPYNDGHYSACSGLVFQTSHVPIADILDGTSKTILLAEKYLDPDFYDHGAINNDDQDPYVGIDGDTIRFTNANYMPHQDTPGYAGLYYDFGSAHAGIFQALFCDGSVHGVSYEIDPTTFQYLGHRKDGHIISASAY
jgi:hypothetical protein